MMVDTKADVSVARKVSLKVKSTAPLWVRQSADDSENSTVGMMEMWLDEKLDDYADILLVLMMVFS